MSKAELARKAGVSVLTIDRKEKGGKLPSGYKKENYSGIRSEII